MESSRPCGGGTVPKSFLRKAFLPRLMVESAYTFHFRCQTDGWYSPALASNIMSNLFGNDGSAAGAQTIAFGRARRSR